MLVIERTADVTAAEPERTPLGGERASSRRAWPVLAMAAGVALVVAALLVVQLASPTPAPASPELTVGGPADVTAQLATYAPGQTTEWHAHTGIHAVMVLSGTVTVYDGECRPRTYGPGDAYIGGQDAHMVRNETVEPVEMSVTYLFPAGQPHTTFHFDSPAPAGCDIR